MINKLYKITDGLYRGAAPSPEDVIWLKNNLGIKKIISFDKATGERISDICHKLKIKHIMLPIDIDNVKSSLLKVLSNNLKELLLSDGPTFYHCLAGKDRTGLITALFNCKFLNKDPENEIKKAKLLGFGIGLDPKITNLFEKLIRSCNQEKPVNKKLEQTIVGNQREYIGDNRDSFLDEAHRGSFAPHLSQTKQYPFDYTYNTINDQSPTRENYDILIELHDDDAIPVVGLFNNEAGGRGFGPVENYSGFFYD